MINTERTVLAIDTGYKNIGFAICKSNHVNAKELLCYGVWDMRSEHKKMNIRSFHAMKKVNDLLIELDKKFRFTNVCVETVPFAKFNGRDATLATTNMFRAYSIIHNKRYSELHATTVKKEMTGNGRAEKSEVRSMVSSLVPGLGDDLAPDVYDAIALGFSSLNKPEVFWDFT